VVVEGAIQTAGEPAYPDDLRALVERYLETLRFSEERTTSTLADAMRYSLLAGGKRIRPVLTLATARALGHDPEELLPTAAAIELVHTYSLIHDDLPAMDDDDLRRGRATCHIAYGENVAILAGDGLFAEAYKLVLERQGGDPEGVVRVLRELSRAIGVAGMVGGQYIDVSAGTDLDEDGLRHMHELKTGKLIAASVVIAPMFCSTSETVTAGLRRFARELGVLFQIVDDILDVVGSQDEMGKPSGADERLGKATYVSVLGLVRARELADEWHERARLALEQVRPMLPGPTLSLEQITNFVYVRRA
jgi:geranylgeranyl diphosphate synthase, type II